MPLNLRAFQEDKESKLNLRAFQSSSPDNKQPTQTSGKLNMRAFGVEPQVQPEENEPTVNLPFQAPVSNTPVQPPAPIIPPEVTKQGGDMLENIKNTISGAVKQAISRLGAQPGALLKDEEEKSIADFAINLAKKVVDGKGRQHTNKPQGIELVKDYATEKITGLFKTGKENLNKPEPLDKATGAVQVAGSLINATPPGVAYNVAQGVAVGATKAVKEGKPLDPEIRKAIISPNTSVATDVFGIQDPAIALVVDLAVSRNPKSIIKDPTGLKGAAKVFQKGKTVAGKSNFRMDKMDAAVLEEAQTMIVHPEKYLDDTIKMGKDTKAQAIQAVRDDAVVTLYKLAQHHLPDAELKKFGLDDRFIPSEKIVDYDVDWNKMATALYELNKKNKLGMISDEGAFGIPNMMGIAGKKQVKTGLEALEQPQSSQSLSGMTPEVSTPKGTSSDVLPSSTQIQQDLPGSLGSKGYQEAASVKTLPQADLPNQGVKTRLNPPEKKATLEKLGTEDLQARQASAALAQEERFLYTQTQIDDINALKRASRSKAAQSGDIETLRKTHPDLTNRVVETVREVKGNNISDEEALNMVKNFPSKADTVAKTPTELVEARGLSKQVKTFMQGVREGKKYSKEEVSVFQKDLTYLLKELPISERGKLTYLSGLRKANTAEKVSKEAEKINSAITKVDEARALASDLGKKRSKIAFIKKIAEFNSTVVRDVKNQLSLKKPIKDMNEQELNQLNAALLGRLNFKKQRGFEPEAPWSDKVVDRVPTESVYEANRQVVADNNRFTTRFKKGVKDAIESPKETLDNLFGSISTRLKNIDPSLKRHMRTFEYNVARAKQTDRKGVEPFVKRIKDKKIDPNDYADLDLAMKNGDSAKMESIFKKYGLEEDFARVRTALDDIYKRADEVGYDIGYRKNYIPRVIKDPEGFLEYIQKGDDWSIIDEAIKAKEMELARYLTTEEKANLINTMVRGYKSGQITLSETGAMKVRSIEVVDDKINQFYGDSVDSLLKYIDSTNDAIEARRFFGKGKTSELTKIDDSIGKYILDLLAEGKIKPSQEKELRDILSARFNPKGTHGFWGNFKNLAYIDTMGSPISAITQIGDLAFAVYKGGPIQAAKAFGRAVVGRSHITKEDIGIEKIATEFEDGRATAKIVDRVFKAVGLSKMDSLGKETLINATIGRYRNLAKNPNEEFLSKLRAVYGSDEVAITKVIDDLKTGKNTEDVKLLAFNELLDMQPVALSEMPVQYLKGGNGRVFYMLKTYTVKQFDIYRNEVWHEMVKNPAKGMRNLVYLTGSLVLANATADEIKDTILGRETSWEDRTIDNLLRLAGFSKFTIYKARQEGAGSAAAQTILPPMKLLDSISKDLTSKNDGEPKGIEDLETPASVPVGGKLYYWWFGKGAQKSEDKKAKSEPKRMTARERILERRKAKQGEKKTAKDRILERRKQRGG